MRVWSCCSQPMSEGEGCSRGPHVFSESTPEDLHARHSFSKTRAPATSDDTAVDVIALDCEMIYTTGGVRVARVSAVDGSGKEIFDELVKTDEGVEIMSVETLSLRLRISDVAFRSCCRDLNTRFSGITEQDCEKAVLTLPSIRRSLDAFINSDTILIGHALENDLKTLRMVHYRCVDTAILFPHRAGPPYRRSLRELCVICFLTVNHFLNVLQGARNAGKNNSDRWRVLRTLLG